MIKKLAKLKKWKIYQFRVANNSNGFELFKKLLKNYLFKQKRILQSCVKLNVIIQTNLNTYGTSLLNI